MIMRRQLLILLYGMIFSPIIAKAEDHFPDDVAGFFHDADLCQYLAGEWDNTLPRKRKNELSYAMERNCSDIYKRQKYFEKKCAQNKLVMQKLKSYEF